MMDNREYKPLKDWRPKFAAEIIDGPPISNVWATAFFVYVALAFWINIFPEWTPAWMLGVF